jgi:mannose-1-phosphate guanylyltransferase/mannose-6-phosphate isomerase
MLNIVILSGGTGEKLWPISREKMPKQYLKLLNEQRSLFEVLLNRILKLQNFINIKINLFVVCNDNNKFLVKDLLENNMKLIPYLIISEPKNRNTTAAISTVLELLSDNDNILILPSDQLWDDNEFCQCIQNMININSENIKFLGIHPYFPATRFGYIETKDNKLVSFKEKPNVEVATDYIKNKNEKYLWNSGVLYFKKKTMIDEINKRYQDIISLIKTTIINSSSKDNILSLNKSLYSNIESVSIDYGILEKYKNGDVVQYDNYWMDIDNFKSLYDVQEKDKNFNHIHACDKNNVITKDTNNSYIYSENKLITTIGISDLVIVDTRDSLLIANKNLSDQVSDIVRTLKSQSRSEQVVNPFCYKPWGWYLNLEGSDYSGHKVKKICVYPNKRLSLQSHKNRSEHWIIVSGSAKVQVGNDILLLNKNQSVYIPKEVIHRIENIGEDNVEFIETQIGDYLGEDDIIRYQDDYNRN